MGKKRRGRQRPDDVRRILTKFEMGRTEADLADKRQRLDADLDELEKIVGAGEEELRRARAKATNEKGRKQLTKIERGVAERDLVCTRAGTLASETMRHTERYAELEKKLARGQVEDTEYARAFWAILMEELRDMREGLETAERDMRGLSFQNAVQLREEIDVRKGRVQTIEEEMASQNAA